MKRRPTEADLASREEARRNAAWLRELAQRGYDDLDRRGKLTIRRPDVSTVTSGGDPERVTREERLADAAWLRALAESAKAELERRSSQPE
jgi:hypothetical protein